MKLSDIKGEQCFDVIAGIIPPAMRLMKDKDVRALFEKKPAKKGQDPYEAFFERMENGLTPLVMKHKDEFITIASTLKGQDKEEYLSTLTFTSLISDVVDLITDDELVSFLS